MSRVRKRLLWHSSRDVTERHYTRRELERLAAAVATIAMEWRLGVGRPEAGTLPPVVPAGTTDSEIEQEFSAPPRRLERPTNGLGRRSDQVSEAECGSGESTPLPPDSDPTIDDPEANGLRHQAHLGGDTKTARATTTDVRAVLAQLLASLDNRLGAGEYSLAVEVVRGNLDLHDLKLPRVQRPPRGWIDLPTEAASATSGRRGILKRLGGARRRIDPDEVLDADVLARTTETPT